MRTRLIALTCGTALSLIGVAVAQQDTRPGQPVPERPATTTETRPGTAVQPRDTTARRPGMQGEPTILRDLVGVWRVEVSINEQAWMHMDKSGGMQRDLQGNRDVNRTPGTPATPATPGNRPTNETPNATNPNDPDNPNRIKDPFKGPDPEKLDNDRTPGATQPANNTQPAGTQPRDPARRDGTTPTQPGVDRDNNLRNNDNNSRRINTISGGKTFTGYAETKMVLGDNFLQQTIVVPDMAIGQGAGMDAQRRDNNLGAGMNNADGMYRGITYIAFDESSDEYGIVFLDSRKGQIHSDKGTFDESARRIVFHGDHGAEMTAPGDNKHHGQGKMRVVLELMSPTQYRVTMFANDSAQGDQNWRSPNDIQLRNPAAPDATTDRDTPAGGNDANRDANKLNNDNNRVDRNNNQPGVDRNNNDPNRNVQPGVDRNNNDLNRNVQPGADRNLGTRDLNSGTIVYQATYTKVGDTDAARYRRLLQEPGAMNDADLRDRDGLRDDANRPLDRDRRDNPNLPADRPNNDPDR